MVDGLLDKNLTLIDCDKKSYQKSKRLHKLRFLNRLIFGLRFYKKKEVWAEFGFPFLSHPLLTGDGPSH